MIIYPARRATWTPGTNVGVIGGIPNRTTIVSTANAAVYGTGLVDAVTEIENVIGAAHNSNGVAYFPAGTYRMDSRVYAPNLLNVTIRGELGPGGEKLTIFKAHTATMEMFIWGSDPDPFANLQNITGGATSGSTQITVASTVTPGSGLRNIVAGDMITISHDNPVWVISNATPTTNTKIQKFTCVVTSVPNSTTINFQPPLPMDFSGSNPTCTNYYTIPRQGIGMEDLCVDGDDISAAQVQWLTAHGCWLKNVELKNANGREVVCAVASLNEFRRNYIHDAATLGSNHEGFDLYDRCCGNLIEDNIIYEAGGIYLGDGTGGSSLNVIGYNFSYGTAFDSNTAVADISNNHGGHNCFNLFEGNICGGFIDDGYHASGSNGTIHRNWCTGTHPFATQNLVAISLCRWAVYHNVIGNILGVTSPPGTVRKIGYPNLGNFSSSLTWGPSTPPDYTLQSANQPGGDGHGGGGNTLQEYDLNVQYWTAFHGNWDGDTGVQTWESNDINVVDHNDHTLLDSYYTTRAEMEARGVVWGSLTFPPINPASPFTVFNDTNLSKLPAGYRYVNGSDPEGRVTFGGTGSTTFGGSGTVTFA